MLDEINIYQWKTHAWASPDMAEWYRHNMVANTGSNRLKNAVEQGYCKYYAIGPRLLDVGIGTGRGSLFLIDQGFKVTGLDSSRAMLDVARLEAGERPIDLRQGDAAALPFPEKSFDSLLSLNVLIHFPCWQEVLENWTRVVRPGGRLIFDIHSRDHVDAVARRREVSPDSLIPPFATPEDYVCYIHTQELVETLDCLGLSIVGIFPYSILYGGDSKNFWLHGSHASGPKWERLLSWLAVDDRMLAFAHFLETRFFAYLPSHTTWRMMVVLERRPDRLRNAAWISHNQALAEAVNAPAPIALLPALWPEEWEEWRAQLHSHLAHPLNRLLLYSLLRAWERFSDSASLLDLLDPTSASLMADWLARAEADQRIFELVTNWHRHSVFDGCLRAYGVDLGEALEYELMADLVTALHPRFFPQVEVQP